MKLYGRICLTGASESVADISRLALAVETTRSIHARGVGTAPALRFTLVNIYTLLSEHTLI
jgi:hypothetical protein